MFLPGSWEVLVTVNNERLLCEFSSVTGGRLLKVKDKTASKKKKHNHTKSEQAINYGMIAYVCVNICIVLIIHFFI